MPNKLSPAGKEAISFRRKFFPFCERSRRTSKLGSGVSGSELIRPSPAGGWLVGLLVCGLLQGAEVPDRGPFEFEALDDGVTVGDVARAISEWGDVSIILPPEAASMGVSGRVSGLDVQGVVEVLEHWTGLPPRQIGDAWFFGGKGRERVQSMESLGLRREELGQVFGQTATVVRDRVFTRLNSRDAEEIAASLAPLARRSSMVLELFSLSSSSNQVERLNAWLERFNVGAEYIAGGVPSASGFEGFRGVADVALFLRLLEDSTFGKVEVRERVQLLSGSRSQFESGTVIETPLIIREPETGKDLVSRVERRTVGLNVTLEGVQVGESWILQITVDDGAFLGGQEVRTTYEGERIVEAGQRWFTLASFTRRTLSETRKGVPLLKDIPVIGKAFRKAETRQDSTEVILLARVVDGNWLPDGQWQDIGLRASAVLPYSIQATGEQEGSQKKFHVEQKSR